MRRKVTLVSYINTLPYLEVLKNSGLYQMDLRVPSQCAAAFKDFSSDIALVPVGSLADIQRPYRRIDRFGIGGDGDVRTVKLLSQKKKEELTHVALDSQSSSSVQLIRILAKHYWQLDLEYQSYNLGDALPEAVLAIGDKVFDLESKYEFAYDMSDEWKSWTGLPFAFAVWIVAEDMPIAAELEFVQQLSQLSSILDSVIQKHTDQYPKYDLKTYLKTNIIYSLSPEYKEAIDLFLKYQLDLVEQV